MIYYHYVIRNRHGTILYSGREISAFNAWEKMFTKYKYPQNEKSISKAINDGLEIHCWEN